MHATDVVANQIARSQHQVAQAAEHAAVAHAPHVKKERQRFLERKTSHLARLAAAWTVIALKLLATRCALVASVGERRQLGRPVLPLTERPQPDGPLLLVKDIGQ